MGWFGLDSNLDRLSCREFLSWPFSKDDFIYVCGHRPKIKELLELLPLLLWTFSSFPFWKVFNGVPRLKLGPNAWQPRVLPLEPQWLCLTKSQKWPNLSLGTSKTWPQTLDQSWPSSQTWCWVQMSDDNFRTVGATNMNEHSSRSHAIFIVTIECSCPTEQVRSSDDDKSSLAYRDMFFCPWLCLIKFAIAPDSTTRHNFVSNWVNWRLTILDQQALNFPYHLIPEETKTFIRKWDWTWALSLCKQPL